MKQIMFKSRLEVWPMGYINDPDLRTKDDKNAEIVQMEFATISEISKEALFIVEVVDDD